MLNIDSLTVADIRQIASLFPAIGGSGILPSDSAIQVGQAYLIRTPTVYHLGRVVRITPTEIVLNEAGWLADTGRFSDCITSGSFSEYEPMGDGVIVPRCNISDMTPWRHALPKERK